MNDEWEATGRRCPECGGAEVTAPWRDDPPELGGAIIGELRSCRNPLCHYWEEL